MDIIKVAAGAVDKTIKAVKSKVTKAANTYTAFDMSTKEARERRVKDDFEYAKVYKSPTTDKFVEYDNYYHNQHYAGEQLLGLKEKYGWSFTLPVLPDPYIQVETQIDPIIPQFQFKGRDDDMDSQKALMRQKVVEFIVYNNKIDQMHTENERNLGKLGNAFWKVSWDAGIRGPNFEGEIVIGNPDPANIFPDPAAYDVDDCEYIMYVYRIHRRKARRRWGKIIDEIADDGYHNDTEIYEGTERSVDDETLQCVEYYYRDDEGDIACSIQVGYREVKHIPKYWIDTRLSGNQMYPFAKYCKVPVGKSFWDKSEIETIKDLVDSADRELFYGLLNDMFMGNDIVVREKSAIINDEIPPTLPGASWIVQDGKVNAVRRLGGVSNNTNMLNMVNFLHDKIEETNGNFATKGSEPTRVTTASGLAQLREDRESRQAIKKADRRAGFQRLYELLDWMALEFYTTDREIIIRGKTKDEQDQRANFNSGTIAGQDRQGNTYYPRIDCEIVTGDGINHSKAFTLAATQELLQIAGNIRPENASVTVPIITSMVDILDLPNKKDIKDAIMGAMQQAPQGDKSGAIPPELIQFADSLPPEIRSQLDAMPQDQGLQMIQQLMSAPPEQQQRILMQMIGGGTGEEEIQG